MREMLNIIEIFILPELIGAVLRLIFRKTKYSWIVTLILAVIAAVFGVLSLTGMGGNYEAPAFYFIVLLLATAGSAVTGIILKLLNRKKAKENA